MSTHVANSARFGRVLTEHFLAHAFRFGLVGAASACVQLALLTLLVRVGLHSWTGNAVAIAIAAQVNFALSQWFTWWDRSAADSLCGRWLRFTCAISSTVALNFGIFAAASLVMEPIAAAASGMAVAATANFVLADRFVFVGRTIERYPARPEGPLNKPIEEA